jgi:hypothetical protein
MAKRITAYVLSALSAPLTFAGLHLILLAIVGPRHFFHQGDLWDWAYAASNEVGNFVFTGTLPALAFFAPVAWLITRKQWNLLRAMGAGAIGGLAYCLYAAANGVWPFMYDLAVSTGTNKPLFYFFGSQYGDVLAFGFDDYGPVALLNILPPVISGMLTAAFFQTLIKPEAERG